MKVSSTILAVAVCTSMLFAATTPAPIVAKTDTAKAKVAVVAVKAPDTTKAKTAVKVVAPKTCKVLSKIISVDVIGSTITAQVSKTVDTFNVAADTKIINGKVALKLSDVFAGENATITYKADGVKKVATLITVSGKAPVVLKAVVAKPKTDSAKTLK